jgi:predicted amidohydrolase
MRITIVQPDIIWEDISGNLKNLDRLIFPLNNKTDLVILPEMFTTGFSVAPARLAESPFSETYEWLIERATSGSFGICGSYIVKEAGLFYNRWVFISPSKDVVTYDKRHLFRMGDEEKAFKSGRERVVFNFRGTRILPNICYDLRFPVWSRNRNDYDLMINSANWPAQRNDTWQTLLKARAMENLCFVAGSNRIGIDGTGIRYCGNSLVINPAGKIIARAGKNREAIISTDISPDELMAFRRKFPSHEDADDFTIQY